MLRLKDAPSAFVTPALRGLWLRGLGTPAALRYGLGVAAALAAGLLRIALNPFWGTNLPYIFFFPMTLLTALFGGLGPALVGIGICAVITVVWVLPPLGVLSVTSPVDFAGLMAYLLIDGLVAWIGAAHRALFEHSERQAAAMTAWEVALARAVADAEAANRAKDNFIAILGHELRNPLATIVAGARVLRQLGSPDEPSSRTRDAIERQADHLSRLVDDLLDMRRIIGGDYTIQRQPSDLAEVVSGAVAALRESATLKEHHVSVHTESACVHGDVVRLQQIVTNLIGNAVKYTPAGGSIRISVVRSGDNAILRVEDTGIGIGPDLLPRMFELFVQGDPAGGRVRSGLGIGLAIVRRLVELHGGTIEVWSDGAGKGSTFTVRLPYSVTAAPSVVRKRDASELRR
jgi:signal transduction histidine kinase